MTRIWKWIVACVLFLLLFNGLGIVLVKLLER
jgi:hypothetical protein